jgi:hypothetical protein
MATVVDELSRAAIRRDKSNCFVNQRVLLFTMTCEGDESDQRGLRGAVSLQVSTVIARRGISCQRLGKLCGVVGREGRGRGRRERKGCVAMAISL